MDPVVSPVSESIIEEASSQFPIPSFLQKYQRVARNFVTQNIHGYLISSMIEQFYKVSV